MSLPLLFVLGYLLAAIGSGVIIAGPVRRVMGFDSAASHADPESSADAQMVLCAVVVGTALVWPVAMTLYYASRFIPASIEAD